MTRRRVDGLDGLRTIACLAVIAYHSALPGFAGGWLGVDVFFVLSGYLITGLLLAEREATGRIRLGRFYARRAARLYPALVILVALSWTVTSDPRQWGIGRDSATLVVLTYTGDLVMGSGRSLGVLNHTWSLAVEEQFYLLWPLLLPACRSRRQLAWAAASGAVVSLTLMLTTGQTAVLGRTAAYFLPHTRVWELLVGCVLACAASWGRRAAGVAVWAGTSLTVGIAVLAQLTGGRRFEAPLMVASVVAAALLVKGIPASAALPARALAAAPLAWIGRRSYGLYLYQLAAWPLLARLPLHGPEVFVAIAATALALAVASYAVIERPVQQWVRGKLDEHDEAATAHRPEPVAR